ncbi:hypothetical protein FAES_4889 [Fibrella aestuarina BUZ 2]|uniref:Peptidase C14 caspase catalytic subunit p20 n=1 Tax=Fibrella aestuarina BUZ 2 TaxID=1166018 RepID=I0KFI5_9BACT|nr:hypothetical protein [Fibrella aestuarina]CCH02888.1 hypothetical protein FAES_4889 [Fibrella aestuarina BUZ 2]
MRHLILLLLTLLGTFGANAQRLHVVYALEQNDRALGLVTLANDELMTQVMKTVEWGLGYPMAITYLPKESFTGVALKKTLANLKTGPKDVIVLYYSGFGLMPTRPADSFANWRFTDVAQRGLAVSDVESWLMAKKARLRVIIADCTTERIRNDKYVAGGIGVGPDLRKQVVRRLFQQPCGLVKLGSSLPTQLAWIREGMPGTVFTIGFNQAFQNLLLSTVDSASLARVSWPFLVENTAGMMNNLLYKLPFGQQPVLEVKPCQRQPGSVTPPTVVDPLANETLSGLFSALLLNPDSLRRAQLTKKLLALCDDKATVAVSRFMSHERYDDPLAINTVPLSYPLRTYLSQLRNPLVPVPATGSASPPVPISSLQVISVVSKEADMAAPKPIKSFALREDWIDY